MALKVGFIGAGKMATALARGFLEGNVLSKPSQIIASCPPQDGHLLGSLKTLGCATTYSNKELVENSDVVLLAVKPSVIPHVLQDIREVVTEKKNLILSLAAGVNLKQLQNGLDMSSKIVRLMPNTPCIVREGASVYTRGQFTDTSDGTIVEKLFSAVGECHEVSEAMIDAVTGVSGSGPAYMYMIIEAMADGGVKQGLPRDLAYKLAAQTMIGAGKMVLDTNQHPAVLKDEVCSPGGTTITALDILEKSGLRTALMQAVEAATVKCGELRTSQ